MLGQQSAVDVFAQSDYSGSFRCLAQLLGPSLKAMRLLKRIPDSEPFRRVQLDTLIALAELAESVQPIRIGRFTNYSDMVEIANI